MSVQASLTYQSPIPPPEVLQGYEQVIPGASARFLKMVEDESLHRRYLERWLVKGGTLMAALGMLCALAIGIFGLYVAWSLASLGHTASASIIAALDITSLVALFLWQHGKQPPQAEEE